MGARSRLTKRLQRAAWTLLASVTLAMSGWHSVDPKQAAAGTEMAEPMAQRLSSKLSPKAKKAVLMDSGGAVVGLVQMAPSTERADLEQEVRRLGGNVESWIADTGLAAIKIPTAQLNELAELDGVVYVEIGERYQR